MQEFVKIESWLLLIIVDKKILSVLSIDFVLTNIYLTK